MLRVADLEASEERDRAARAARSPEDYLRSLEVVLTFASNVPEHLGRMAALSNKTNQFNTALCRFSETQVARRLGDPRCRTISVGLRDRLSDSGIVAVLFARQDGPALVVDELVISCRALGRSIEHAIVTGALRRALADLPANEVRFRFRDGPRNEPARVFLSGYAGCAVGPDGVALPWDDARAAQALAKLPISIVHEERP